MVRFSDIIKSKGNHEGRKKQPETVNQEEHFRFSDSRLFKFRNSDPRTAIRAESPKRKASNFELNSYYKAFVKRAIETGNAVKNNRAVSPAAMLADLHTVVEKNLVEPLYEYAAKQKPDIEEMHIHTVNVTLTSLKIGKGLNYDIKMMLRLGLAAFLENIGSYKIPGDIIASPEALSDHEIDMIKKHSETAYHRILELGERYKWLAETAICIHERSDGSGYPSGLKGDEIPELASVIAIADTYCAMASDRPHRKKIKRTDAVNYFTGKGKEKFPSAVIKAFIREMSLIPVNTVVKLNNGSIGRVISTNKNYPLNPVVEIISSGNKRTPDDRQQINLADNPLLYIAASIDEPDDQ